MKEETESIVKIYGLPLEVVHDKRIGPILDGMADYPFFGILYCGFKTSLNEIRQPTQRLWYFRKEDVENSGIVEDYKIDEQNVHYYEIDLHINIQEKHFELVRLGDELTWKPKIFASKVMKLPEGGVDISEMEKMTFEDLEKVVANLIEAEKPEMKVKTMMSGICKSYKKTRYDPWVRRDCTGADIPMYE